MPILVRSSGEDLFFLAMADDVSEGYERPFFFSNTPSTSRPLLVAQSHQRLATIMHQLVTITKDHSINNLTWLL